MSCTTSNVIHAGCLSDEDHESDEWRSKRESRWQNFTFSYSLHLDLCFWLFCFWLLLLRFLFIFAHAYRVWVAMQQKVPNGKMQLNMHGKRWKAGFTNRNGQFAPSLISTYWSKTGLWFSFKMFCFYISLDNLFLQIFFSGRFFLITAEFCCYVIASFICEKKAMGRLSDNFFIL